MTTASPPRFRLAYLRVNAPAALLLLAAAYGVFSVPALVDRWGGSAAGMTLLAGWALLAGWTLSTGRRSPARAGWCAFAVAATTLRIGSAILAAHRVSPGDSQSYLDLAAGLLAGRGLVVEDAYLGIAVRAFYPPLYPLVLAGWGAVAGFSTASLLALSTLIDLATAAAIVRLAAMLGERRAGVAAAAAYLVWPAVLLSAPLAQKEGLAVLFAVLLAAEWCGSRRVWAIGAAAGLLALTQPSWATLAALLGVAMVPAIGWRGVLRAGVPAAGVAAAVMLPWWIRNWLVLGAFVPLTSASGLSLWIGNNPVATGRWMAYPASFRGMPELAVSRIAKHGATAWMTAHPAAVLRLTAAKFVRAVGLAQGGVSRLAVMLPPIPPAATALLLPVAQGAQTALLAGAALALRSARDRATALVVAVLAQLLLFGVWFEFDERHRDVLTPFLLLVVAIRVGTIRRRTVPAVPFSAPPAAAIPPGPPASPGASPPR